MPPSENSVWELARLADLAVGTPEVGAVNFNALHALLHALLRRLGLSEEKVEVDIETQAAITNAGLAPPPQNGEKEGENQHSPLHALQSRLRALERQIEGLNALPRNSQIIDQMLSEHCPDADQRAVTDLWQNLQLRRRVDANSEGLDRLSALVDDLLRQLRGLKAAQEDLEKRMDEFADMKDSLAGLTNFADDLNDLKEMTAILEVTVTSLPHAEFLADAVTWTDLKDGLESGRRSPKDSARLSEASREEAEGRQGSSRASDSIGHQVASSRASDSIAHELVSPPPSEVDLEAAGSDRSGSRVASDRKDSEDAGLRGEIVPCGESEELKRDSATGQEVSEDQKAKEAVHEALGQLGLLPDRHEALEKRVKDLEDLMALKADKDEMEERLNEILKRLDELAEELARSKEEKGALSDEDLNGIRDLLAKLQDELDALNNVVDDLVNGQKDLCDRIQDLKDGLMDLDKRKVDFPCFDDLANKKADKRDLDNKVNFALFEQSMERFNKLIDDLFGKMSTLEGELRQELAATAEAAEAAAANNLGGAGGRGGRGGLTAPVGTPSHGGGTLVSGEAAGGGGGRTAAAADVTALRSEMERRLRELGGRVRELMLREMSDEDAAGMRKKLTSHFHCISCDRPLDVLAQHPYPSHPEKMPSKLNRAPHCTNEAFARSQFSKYPLPGITPTYRSPYPVYRPHSTRNSVGDIVDPYRTPRAAGGTHTAGGKSVTPGRTTAYKEDELDIMGADGHIYRGRTERIVYTSYPVPGLPPVDEQEQRPRSAGGGRSQRSNGRSRVRPTSGGDRREIVEDLSTALAVPNSYN